VHDVGTHLAYYVQSHCDCHLYCYIIDLLTYSVRMSVHADRRSGVGVLPLGLGMRCALVLRVIWRWPMRWPRPDTLGLARAVTSVGRAVPHE
jgi:hypothetical protein